MLENAATMKPPVPTPSRRGLARIGIAIAALALLLFAGREAAGYLPGFIGWIDGLGFWGPAVFIAGYAAATVAFVPGAPLTLAAGAIFGLSKGVPVVFIGASVGATLAFLVARYAARSWVETRLALNGKFAAIDEAVGEHGLKIVALLRLSPIFPFNALNYVLGLTKVRMRDYVIAHIGMLPGTLLYVYYGKLAGDVAALAGGATQRGAGYWVVLVLGLIATLGVTTIVTRIARRALKEITHE